LVRALRYRGDEVQLGRALHEVCLDDKVARAFSVGLLELVLASGGDKAAKRLLERMPAEVTCSEQTHLFADVGRNSLRRRIERVGVVDLDFKGGRGWRLIVELKLDAPFGPSQRPRYLAARHPLVAVMRRAALDDEVRPGTDGGPWLGAVTWEALLPVLRSLPITAKSTAAQWSELLDVAMEDGDFAKQRAARTKTGKEAAGALEQAWPDLQAVFVAAVGKKHGKRAAKTFEDAIVPRHGGGRDGAGIGIATSADDQWLAWVTLTEPQSTAPAIAVSWRPPPGRRAKRDLAAAHARLEQNGFEQRAEGQWMRQYALPSSDVRDLGLVGAIRNHVGQDLTEIARSGVLQLDVLELRESRP
jgi:hypothetical protein